MTGAMDPCAFELGIAPDGTATDRRRATEAALRMANAELARSNADLAQFAQAASHDLAEPLRNVMSYVQRLERRNGAALDDEGRLCVDEIITGVQRMRGVIDGLIAYVEATRDDASFGEVALDDALDDALADLGLEPGAVTRTSTGLPVVAGDRGQLTLVLAHLIDNARRFGAGRVEVVARVEGPACHLQVRDDGPGIEPEHRERVFLMFSRLQPKDHHESAGVGLAVCRKIVDAHGGRIWVDGAPGGGAAVCITLARA